MILMLGAKSDDVRALQLHLAAHGFQCGKIDGDFGNKTLAAVKAFQTAKGLTASGVVDGPTWNAVLQEPTLSADDRLAAAGLVAAARIEALWRMDIIDPPVGSKHPRARDSLEVINAIIRRNGWTWILPYLGNGPPQWCTMTDGDAWAEAGLDPTWLVDYFASTDRLIEWASYRRWSPKAKPNPAPTGTDRRLLVDLRKPLTITPRRGDIVLVGSGSRHAGNHGTLLMGYDDGVYDTISGNGGGVGPNGDRRDFRGGISRRDYKLGTGGYEPMWLIRPAASDLL